MKLLFKGLTVGAALALSACGGGGDGPLCTGFGGTINTCPGSTNNPPPSTAVPAGIWGGATSDGNAVSLLVLETGQYFLVPTSSSGTDLVEGIMTASNFNFSDPAAVVYPSSSMPVAATVSGSFTTAKSLSGTVATTAPLSSPLAQGATSTAFNGDYNSLYDKPATVTEAVGNWSGQTSASTLPITVSIATDGTLTGANGSCSFTGSVAPRSTGKHVLNGMLTFNTSGCILGAGNSLNIEAVVLGNQLVAAGVTPQRDHGFAIVATKN
ncbi:hypothetical protein [Paraburkholderia caballeronis]|uniref:hypothetical protein n=1 Tax=Paraburkholderia caballeronis TaxID=416943 RepID=UPI00106637B9|nr:hypothetical protein [Paraburkholderia caballeronis]TDV04657.1 hypothetical protein C7408_13119 [Paraburkholderia caballeronis]TDV07900.1 hypothetical protein C7406_13319 [Paraburkholderia caballeronis]TDV18191.1 hypothetical protein C7404_13119 [Paraburkholderia caballeronis]